MIVVLPVANIGQWEIERFIVFDTCIHCGKTREKESMGTFKVGKKRETCYTAGCDCIEQVGLYSAVEEHGIIKLLKSLKIIPYKPYK